jgi:hypothetical protein
MTKPALILVALRDRLVNAGYTVHLGRVIDPLQDTLPVVSLCHMPDGDQTQGVRPKSSRALELVAEYWGHVATAHLSDPILHLIPIGEALESALIKPDGGGVDRLDGLAIQVEHIKTILAAHEQSSDIGQAQVAIRIKYVRS